LFLVLLRLLVLLLLFRLLLLLLFSGTVPEADSPPKPALPSLGCGLKAGGI
jgi:hypothetical protein